MMLIPVFDGQRAGVQSTKIIQGTTLDLVGTYAMDNIESETTLQVELENLLKDPNLDKFHSYYASRILNSLKSNGYDIPVYYSNISTVQPTWLAWYSPTRHFIGINSAKGKPSATTILHEATHAFTLRELAMNAKFRADMTKL